MPTPPVRLVPRALVWGFFGLLLGLGSLVVSDYGVSWDEPFDRTNGLVNVRYLAELVAPAWVARQPGHARVPPLATHRDRDYGPLFEAPLAALAALRGGPDRRFYHLLRHVAVFGVSLLGIWALFRLATRRFGDERLGLLAAGLLVLSPRFFAESFYNGKDLVFMALFTLGILTLTWLLERPSWRRALLHALATAAATDVRVLGLLLVPLSLAGLALRYASEPALGRRALRWAGLVYGPATAAAVVVGWPYLWANPLGNLQAAFHNMSHFRWTGQLLYLGHVVPATALPWHYAPVWLSITTPVTYQLAALLGVGVAGAGLLRRPQAALRTPAGQLDALLLGWLLLPLLLVIYFKSVLYDGWRHLYFIYPALLLLAIRGGLAVARLGQRGAGWRRLVRGLGLLAGAEAALTAGRMVLMHPHQQTYFSYLPRRQAERLFERDYWGLSFRQGLAFLVAYQPKGPILVQASNLLPLENNAVWLCPADRARLVTMPPPGAARYFITNYRTVAGDYPRSVGPEIFTVRADGVKILSVFLLPTAHAAPAP